jgi:CheY-like chemotaxis protein
MALSIQVAAQSPSSVTLDVVVSDTGIGIEPDKLRQLMNDFGQVEGSASRRFGGSGLGLAICRRLLGLMGSELRANSEPGRGSRFGFRLTVPVSTDPATPLAAPPDGVCVLVADSRAVTRQAHARLARNLGWQAVEAQGLQDALDTLRQSGHLNLVLADWRLDGSSSLSGALELTQKVAGRSVPVIVTGGELGRDQLTSLPEAQRQKLSGYLCGPATAHMLAEAVAEAHGTWAPQPVATNAAKPLAGLRVLVAEDNENNQIVTRELLQEQGAHVEIAIDGLDALTRLVAGGQYDVILMDWQMPNMDGLEASREIRQIVGYQHIPIIALTANATAADRAACLEAGMNAHLGKPVDLTELVATLLRYTRPGQG